MKYKEGKLTVERSDWTEKKAPPPGERWDMILPVLNLHVDGLYIFASCSIEDDPPNDWAWIVFVDKELTDQPRSSWQKLIRVESHDCFPEEEAIERCSRAAEHLFAVAKLSLEGQL